MDKNELERKMNLLLEVQSKAPAHPAMFNDKLIPVFVRMLKGRSRILDPFGGTGKIFMLENWMPDAEFQAVEIEPEWASIHPKTTLGDALNLKWESGYFDAICTSPTYGNRMADKWSQCTTIPRGKYSWNLRRELSEGNSGRLHWGDRYKDFHIRAWNEARRVLSDDGIFVLNIKDHIRLGEVQQVTDWHIDTLQSIGFQQIEHVKIECNGITFGKHYEKRIPYESVLLFGLRSNKVLQPTADHAEVENHSHQPGLL